MGVVTAVIDSIRVYDNDSHFALNDDRTTSM